MEPLHKGKDTFDIKSLLVFSFTLFLKLNCPSGTYLGLKSCVESLGMFSFCETD